MEIKGVPSARCVKAVWPIADKSVTSVLMSAEGKGYLNIFSLFFPKFYFILLNLQFFSLAGLGSFTDTLNSPVTVRKITSPIQPAQMIGVSLQNNDCFEGQKINDILLLLKKKYCGKHLQVRNTLFVPYYGRKLKFSIKAVLPQGVSEVASPLEEITTNLENMTFAELQGEKVVSCSTPLREQSGQMTPEFNTVSSSEQTPLRKPTRKILYTDSSSERTPIRRPFRNMLEDSYVGSSAEESRDELSTTVDSIFESPLPEPVPSMLLIYQAVNSTKWVSKDMVKTDGKDAASQFNHISSVGGLQHVIDEVKEIMSLALIPSNSWKQKLRITKGVLLFGPSGTGKTLLANALAQDSKVPVHSLMGSELFSKVLGETDARLRAFFTKATSSGPSVIVLDEVDSLCSKKANSSGGTEVERRVITTLCTLLDELSSGNKCAFVIATTSRPDSLEPSLRRPGR